MLIHLYSHAPTFDRNPSPKLSHNKNKKNAKLSEGLNQPPHSVSEAKMNQPRAFSGFCMCNFFCMQISTRLRLFCALTAQTGPWLQKAEVIIMSQRTNFTNRSLNSQFERFHQEICAQRNGTFGSLSKNSWTAAVSGT